MLKRRSISAAMSLPQPTVSSGLPSGRSRCMCSPPSSARFSSTRGQNWLQRVAPFLPREALVSGLVALEHLALNDPLGSAKLHREPHFGRMRLAYDSPRHGCEIRPAARHREIGKLFIFERNVDALGPHMGARARQ